MVACFEIYLSVHFKLPSRGLKVTSLKLSEIPHAQLSAIVFQLYVVADV